MKKTFVKSIMFLAMLVTFASCEKAGNEPVTPEETIEVKQLIITQTELTFEAIGEKAKLELQILPSNATDKTVNWESSNPGVATVDKNGEVTAVGFGETTIKVQTPSKRKTAKCMVYVLKPTPDYIDQNGNNYGKGVTVSGTTWAPVNCGFDENKFPYGKYYQWGRIDGHHHSNTGLIVKNTAPKTLEEAEPNVFYQIWSTKVAVPGTWGGEDGITKTKHDPCPEGWRVPSYDELALLTQNTSGWEEHEGYKGIWLTGGNK